MQVSMGRVAAQQVDERVEDGGMKDYLLSFAGQLRMTDMGWVSGWRTGMLMRKRWPSRLTSYTNRSYTKTGWRGAVWKRAAGAPASKLVPVVTGVAISLKSGERKNSSLPSPRQRGCSPPPEEICHLPCASGNEVT